jgi:hypothetical protein
MIKFNEHLKVDEETLYFSFNRIYNADGEKFYVVVQKGRQFSPFDMKKDDAGRWKIVEPSPAWAKALEEQLSEMIDRNI